MLIRTGFEIIYDCPQPIPMLLMLHPHPSRTPDLVTPPAVSSAPPVAARSYNDGFGNLCTRLVAPAGRITLAADFTLRDTGQPDPVVPGARRQAVEDLPDEVLVYLLGSRYCDTDLLSETAWAKFGQMEPGWGMVQAICDFAHSHVTFGYEHARATRTASEAFTERHGVCRDYAHLAITLCRCLNIPARYCTGWLGDIRLPPAPDPMDFAAWFEVYLDGRWHTFDARNNTPRIGRVLMARGRDATDVAIATTFGSCTLAGFRVIAEEVPEG